jgi:riboflavin transporter FmnP
MFSNPLFFGLLNVAIIVPLFIFIMNGIKNKDKQSNVKTSPMKEIVALGVISFVSISLTCYLVFEQITQAPTEEFLTGGAPF